MITLGTLFKKNITGSQDQPAGYRTQINENGRREIRPRLYQDICGMCGRTILTGERTSMFTHPDAGHPVVVCPHCREEARQNGYQKAA